MHTFPIGASLPRREHRAARRHALAIAGATLLAAGLPGAALAQPKRELRIGFQKYGTLTILKGRGTLEPRLREKNVTVKWTEFPAGPVLLEGLNVGSIDFGTVGEAPPIFAQAAGANLVYVGHEPPSPRSEAIVVPKGSALRTLADLRGKKIALNKGSNVHYLLVKALEKAGIPYQDVQAVFLPPADARAAFERNAVDAWAIWDPYAAIGELNDGMRILPVERSLAPGLGFLFGTDTSLAAKRPLLADLSRRLAAARAWGETHREDYAQMLTRQTGVPIAATRLYLSRSVNVPVQITPALIAEEQGIADLFHQAGLLDTAVQAAPHFAQI